MTIFQEKVLNIVRQIPKGSTLSYKEIAIKAGNPNAYRAVGSIMRKNFDATVPCHRVIHADGRIGQYNRGGENKKKELLENELLGKAKLNNKKLISKRISR